MLQSSAKQFLAVECPTTLVRELELSGQGYSPDLWRKMAGLGWLGLPFPKKYGGENGSIFDLGLLIEEMGAVLLPSPYIPTIVGGLAILLFGDEKQKRQFIPAIAKGDLIITEALYGAHNILTEDSVANSAATLGNGYILSGCNTFVADLQAAQKCIISARTSKGVSTFCIDTQIPGLSKQPLITLASDKQWEMVLEGVKITQDALLGEDGGGWAIVERILELYTCLLCSYMSGAVQRVVDMSNSYAKQRIQFGRPIASFQTTSHRLVDMLLAAEGSKFITYEACWKLANGMPASFEVSAAKAFVGKSFHRTSEDAMRIYGALGSTQECDIQLYYRRATALELYQGDSYHHNSKIAQQMGI